jgi:uncharacterized membrane protein HdeD (DUF308 family)
MNREEITDAKPRLARVWKAVAVRGVTGVAFGVAALAWPGIRLTQLAALVSAFALVDGLAAAVGALRPRINARERAWLASGGVVSLATGVAVAASPGLSARDLLYPVAGWAVATGLLEFSAAGVLPLVDPVAPLLIVGGLVSAFFGVTMFVKPGGGAVALLPLIASFGIVTGVARLALGDGLRHHLPDAERRPSRPGRKLARL